MPRYPRPARLQQFYKPPELASWSHGRKNILEIEVEGSGWHRYDNLGSLPVFRRIVSQSLNVKATKGVKFKMRGMDDPRIDQGFMEWYQYWTAQMERTDKW